MASITSTAFSNGSFKWDNEKKTRVLHGFQNWFPGHPNNFGDVGNQKNCMAMGFKGKWTSEKCNSKYYIRIVFIFDHQKL